MGKVLTLIGAYGLVRVFDAGEKHAPRDERFQIFLREGGRWKLVDALPVREDACSIARVLAGRARGG